VPFVVKNLAQEERISSVRFSLFEPIMNIPALTVGYAVPETDFTATIHSVFRSAVNLRPDGGDLLLTLVTADQADLPQGIRLDTPPGFSFELLHPGDAVSFCDGYLAFGSCRAKFISPYRWRCDLPALSINLSNPAMAAAWECAWQALNERQMRMGAEIGAVNLLQPDARGQSLTARKMGEAIRGLKENPTTAIQQLIGLGSGLTPSGDDFLVGYLAGLWSGVCNSPERRQFVTDLGEAVIRLAGRTNDISRTYLFHAAHGQVSSRLEALAKAISEGKAPGQLLPIAEAAMQLGHTSGMDAVTGLLFGLAA
jgi:hypothetical protein